MGAALTRNIIAKIKKVLNELTKRELNNCLVPRENIGSTSLAKVNGMLQLFNNKTAFQPIALG